jgi:hypothetical protein
MPLHTHTNTHTPLKALGIKPKSSGPGGAAGLQQPALEAHEVQRLLRGAPDADAPPPDAAGQADRIKGLGFKAG